MTDTTRCSEHQVVGEKSKSPILPGQIDIPRLSEATWWPRLAWPCGDAYGSFLNPLYLLYMASSSLLLLRVGGRSGAGAGARLERMFVGTSPKHLTALFLRTDVAASHPFVLDDLIKRGSLLWVDL